MIREIPKVADEDVNIEDYLPNGDKSSFLSELSGYTIREEPDVNASEEPSSDEQQALNDQDSHVESNADLLPPDHEVD